MENLKYKQKVVEQPTSLYKTRIVEPVSLDIKIAGKLPAYDVELDEQEDRWIISEEDKLRKTSQLFTN